jgi:hypothetical protein
MPSGIVGVTEADGGTAEMMTANLIGSFLLRSF